VQFLWASVREADVQVMEVVELQAEMKQDVQRTAKLFLHCVAHCPCRLWCRQGVEGQGQELVQRRRKEANLSRALLVRS